VNDRPPLVLVGGALRSAADYRPLADALAPWFTVHLMERRGRPGYEPIGPDYRIDLDVNDVLARAELTGARIVVGHSFGGLVALEAARRTRDLTHVAVYEPGVSNVGARSYAWLADYERLLTRGDERRAFAAFTRGSGAGPPATQHLPLWYLALMIRIMVPRERWQRMRPLLWANLYEHREVARLDGTMASYSALRPQLLVLAGGKTFARMKTACRELAGTVAGAEFHELRGLDHFAPEEKPQAIAETIARFCAAQKRREVGPPDRLGAAG